MKGQMNNVDESTSSNLSLTKGNDQDDKNENIIQSWNNHQQQQILNENKMDMGNKQYQIFLGGSCNPTTWRHTVAIPILKDFGITFYNPQVDNWTPEMVQLESRAKSDAEILFFVIDKQTRSTVGMIESAFIAGSNKRLILVIYPFSIDSNTQIIANSNSSQQIDNIINSTGLTTMTSATFNMTSYQASSSSLSSMSIDTPLLAQSLSDSNLEYSPIKISGEYISALEFSELRRARLLLQDLVLNQNIPIFCDTKLALIHAVECLKNKRIASHPSRSGISIGEEQRQSLEKKNRSHRCNESVSSLNEEDYKDIYLCLTDGDQSWRESKALPWFHKNGLSCNFVQSDGQDILLTKKEIDAIERSRVLLFVITNKCRGLSVMLLAAHYMSLGREDVVLCIQYLEEPCVIGGEILSKTAVADYNRGRIYLDDHAKNSHVPVFSDLDEAIECCGRKGKTGDNSHRKFENEEH